MAESASTTAEEGTQQVVLVEPLKVVYCGVCGFPPEYCEYGKNFAKCLEWMKQNAPEEYEKASQAVKAAPAQQDQQQQQQPQQQQQAQQQQPQQQQQQQQQSAPAPAEEQKADPGAQEPKKKESKKVRVVEEKFITITIKQRQKKKSNTYVKGLTQFDISLKEASKKFRQKFATGSSVDDAEDTVEIQGEVADGVIELLCKEYKQLNPQVFKIVDNA